MAKFQTNSPRLDNAKKIKYLELFEEQVKMERQLEKAGMRRQSVRRAGCKVAEACFTKPLYANAWWRLKRERSDTYSSKS